MEQREVGWNVYRSLDPRPSEEGGAGYIESPEDTWLNITWQTRERAPSAKEVELASAIEEIFRSGVEEIEALVDALNAGGPAPPEGSGRWTEETLLAVIEGFAGPDSHGAGIQ